MSAVVCNGVSFGDSSHAKMCEMGGGGRLNKLWLCAMSDFRSELEHSLAMKQKEQAEILERKRATEFGHLEVRVSTTVKCTK